MYENNRTLAHSIIYFSCMIDIKGGIKPKVQGSRFKSVFEMLLVFLLSLIETGQTTVTVTQAYELTGQNDAEQQEGASIESFVENLDVNTFCKGSSDSNGAESADPIPFVHVFITRLDEELTKLFMNQSFQAFSLLDLAKIAKGGFILSINHAKIKNFSQSLTMHGAPRSILQHFQLIMNIMWLLKIGPIQ